MSRSRLRPYWGGIAALTVAGLPFVALLILGILWLWQQGAMLVWLAAAALASAAAAVVWRNWRARMARSADPAPPQDAAWSPRDVAAWAAVAKLADAAPGTILADLDALADTAARTMETVARHYRPDDAAAVWSFTLPEALLLGERVSRELRALVLQNIPFGERIRVGQVMRLYGWKPYLDHVRTATGAYRALRVALNPLLALAAELREKLTSGVVSAAVDLVTARIARLLVLEIGRAAIDLYGGRMVLAGAELAAHDSDAEARDAARQPPPPEPLRLVLAGQVSAGKSSLVNALSAEVRAAADVLPTTRRFTPYALARDGLPAALILDGPGLGGDPAQLDPLLEEMDDADLILWVVAANRPAREIDRAGLDRVRAHFVALPSRRPPPMLLVVTHIDRLRPFGEWNPPYDLRAPASPKAEAIRDAVVSIGSELGFAAEDVVPACLSESVGRYNVDALWARIAALAGEARKAQLNRLLVEAGTRTDWSRVWDQALGAGRVLRRLAGV